MHSGWWSSTFLTVLKFLRVKEGRHNFWVNPILQKVWIIWSFLLYFKFKSFMEKISSSLIRSQCILDDGGVLFSESSNFYKLKKGYLISWGNQFCWKSELFGPPFCISILKVFWTQIHRLPLHLNAFFMTEEHFSQSLEISASWRGRT